MKPARPIVALAAFLAAACLHAQVANPDCPTTTGALYARIRTLGLDPQRIYHVRDASLDRPSLHLDFDDGTLAFTEDLCGRITGAFFDGEGEIRLRPPNRAERGSLALFTGMAILEEQFTSAYLRFNDDTAAALQPALTPEPAATEFAKQWAGNARSLAEFDALRLLVDFSHLLPASAPTPPERSFQPFLHAHLLGKKLGAFEVFSDASLPEPLWVGQSRVKNDAVFFDVWTSFAPGSNEKASTSPPIDAAITQFCIRASVQPPTKLQAATDLTVRIRRGGQRTLLFELSRYLKIDAISADGRAVDFIQNPAIEGTALQRKGNDLVAVVFSAPLATGQEVKMHFSYAGDVLSEAGSGLLYVGARGTWYPNFGLSPALFEMEFRYPANWTLVATGKRISPASGEAETEAETDPDAEKNSTKITGKTNQGLTEKVSRWTSERPIPMAGFNLGKYVRAEAKAGNILVEVYGARGVEKSFPQPPSVIAPPAFPRLPTGAPASFPPIVTPKFPPSPAHNAQAVADKAATAIASFSQWFGPYPYASLSLTQMPGTLSQGWPALVFLSSFAFLSPQEQLDLHLDSLTSEIDNQVLVHETAHQWWGDLVLWKSYRDQWISEGLADYAALLTLEQQKPAQFQQILEKYRSDLLSQNGDGERLRDAGPVTLGQRLDSSHFPSGYEAISYERGAWLFHMLRTMLRDSAAHDSSAASHPRKTRANPDEPFFRALRKIRERYAGKPLSTAEMIRVFEEDLPRPLWYEKRPNLDWFLDGWVEGTAIPELQTRDIRFLQKAGVTIVTGVIVQKDVPEDLVTAVPVYASTVGNAQVFLGEVLADGAETAFRFPAPNDARKIVLDPRHTILSVLK